MARGYAAGTTVAASQTQGEIMGLLGSRGVTKIATFVEPQKFSLAFEHGGVPYRVTLPLPDPDAARFTKYKQGSVWFDRTENAARELYEKELNRRWRAFGMVIKAKIVAVEEGISTMEAEFIGNLVLKGGRTVAETYSEDLPALAASGQVAHLALPGAGR